jgi:coproporphyrinogen III oxidase-like Fe-S oxidoreductase
MMMDIFQDYFSKAPVTFDAGSILRYYLALNRKYTVENNHMPLPIWRRKGFTDNEPRAWERLQKINEAAPVDRGLSIYIHVPFCPTRCSFCDCLTMQLQNHVDRVLDGYLALLINEIQAWKGLGTLSQRPVTTVHFGGGTAFFLGQERFRILVETIRSSFHTGPDTEWAFETTSSSLNDSAFECLHSLGFRRLHLGVQSMEDTVRPLLKRRENSARVLEKIRTARALEWIVSVDLLVGLPRETLGGMLDGIAALMEAGSDGFSVYEINISNQNMHFTQQYRLLERDRRVNYFLFLAAIEVLRNSGYKKNLFNHFANERDHNLYFTFPVRHEDCLAMGAYADGVFSDYHYRHPRYLDYLRRSTDQFPALQGGIEKPENAKRLFPLEIAVLSGEFTMDQFSSVFSKVDCRALLNDWKSAMLIEETEPGCYSLTANGAWFSGNMIQDLNQVNGSA